MPSDTSSLPSSVVASDLHGSKVSNTSQRSFLSLIIGLHQLWKNGLIPEASGGRDIRPGCGEMVWEKVRGTTRASVSTLALHIYTDLIKSDQPNDWFP